MSSLLDAFAALSIVARATPEEIQEQSPYGYTPTKYVTIIFLALFIVSSIAHLAQAIKFRMWWATWTILLCGGLEIAGWAGRLWSSINVTNGDAFQLQIVATIIGPTPLLAAVFIIFGRLIRVLGLSYSRFAPRTYTIVFVSSDIISLVVQGVGGGIAASGDTREQTALGANIMLGGISFQLVVIVMFSLVFCDYLIRYFNDRPYTRTVNDSSNSLAALKKNVPNKKHSIMTWTLVFVVLTLFIRAVYRIVELAGGWNGPVIETEVYFNVLDGAMITIAMYALNIVHPGMFLAEAWKPQPEYNSAETLSMEQLNNGGHTTV